MSKASVTVNVRVREEDVRASVEALMQLIRDGIESGEVGFDIDVVDGDTDE